MSIFEQILLPDSTKEISGLTNELKALYLANYCKKQKKSILLVTSTLYEANLLYKKILNYYPNTLFFPMDDFLTSEALAISPELKFTRLETLSLINNNINQIIVTNLMGYLRYLPLKKVYDRCKIKLKVNDEYELSTLVKKLYNLGYERETLVNKTGEIAVRGFVLDLFPINFNNPIRIEFWGDEIESIREFNIDSQLTIKQLKEVELVPITETIIDSEKDNKLIKHRNMINYVEVTNINNYIKDPLVFYIDYNNIQNQYELLLQEIEEYNRNNDLDINTKYMHDLDDIKISDVYYLSNFDNQVLPNVKKYKSRTLENFNCSINQIIEQLKEYIKNKKIVIICLKDRYQFDRITKMINSNDMILTNENEIFENKINVIIKKIDEGFIFNNYIVISEKELFNQKSENQVYKTNFKYGSRIRDINKLSIGDYIVHNVNGIGIYKGIQTLVKKGLKKDYLVLEYRDGDKLYIPVERLELITKYSASDGQVPKLNKLGGTEWKKTKLKIKDKIKNIAGDLLKLYAERESTQGFSFKKDNQLQLQFEKEFIYEETPDQIKVIEEIKKDMERPHPMDRLLCGDVGYGKTEVAFRAIFKAIMSGKQVALLCPTTILSSQHFNNSKERFKSFPVEIELLNRFVNSKKQKEIIERVKEGKVDLLIGTHRILSKDINFKNLGLLVVDEEQRFGVTHKEKIKQYKANIDVLTLSATPIPRTLQMSMTGLRSLSLIETAPSNRYPVQTYVLEESNQIIKDAIYKEIARNGQAFILYNRVENMDLKLAELQRLIPEASFGMANGRMNKNQLEKVMLDFINHKFNVMLCTTIIETGIDIPSVNTLIIIDADHFGLSQLYQIRGRVGRSDKIAYCYLMYKKGKVLSDIATKRLSAIKEFTELGSGFALAMRDLAIRGAGDLLGSEQAGFIDSVGVELFIKMLNEEVDRLKGKEVVEETKEQPYLEVSTSISDNYVSEEDLKMEIHKKINNIQTLEDISIIKNELEDRFGKIDEDLTIYMYEELFESKAKNLDIKKIRQTKDNISITLTSELTNNINGDNLFINLYSLTKYIKFSMIDKELTITLNNINKLDKHYVYYMIDMLDIINEAIKK